MFDFLLGAILSIVLITVVIPYILVSIYSSMVDSWREFKKEGKRNLEFIKGEMEERKKRKEEKDNK